ncbi:mucin-12-like [Prionailurus bengalensis]|uniref:mucin-12-like n=1 Tax=Prionailurus bengalensis TaxID=37029 RepID=UPI001CA91B54|nr:mucin-12-like [Prionailurus bengalensis]
MKAEVETPKRKIEKSVTDLGLTEGSTLHTGTPDLSKSAVISDRTVTKEDGLSASTSKTTESFTTKDDHVQTTTSFAGGSTSYTSPSELSTSTFFTNTSYSTDNASPASESRISELSTLTVVTERTDPTLTGDTTIRTSVSDSSETTVSPEVSHATGAASSVTPWSPGEASISPAVSGPTATGVTQISTDLSTISDSSKPTDSSVTTFTREYGSPEPTSSPSDAFSTSSSFGQTTMFFPVASTVSSTLSDSSNPTFSPDTPHTTDKESPSSSLGPGPSPTSTEVSGQTATPFTKETTAYTHISDLSTTPTSGETSYTQDDEGTTSPSSPGLLSSNPGISGQTNTGLTEGPSVYTDTPNGSKPTSTSDSTVTKEDGSSASTSGPAESFTTSGVDPHTGTTLPPRSPPYTTTSEVSAPTVSTHSSYSTDEESATSQSSSSDLLTTSVLSEQSARTLTEKPTVHTISDSSESTASSYSFRTPGLGSSAAPSSPGEFSSSPVGSRLTASTATQPPTEHSTVSDSSQPPDSSATTYTKDDESHVSTSAPTESLTTGSSYSAGSSTPSDHEGFPTASLTTGHSATTFTGLPSVFKTMPDLSEAAVSSETFYTRDDGSAMSPSNSGHLSSTLSASAHTTTGLVKGSSMVTGTTHSSEPTVISESTVTKEDGLSASTSKTTESFTTKDDHQQTTTSIAGGSTFYSPSELSTPTFSTTHTSYSTDNASPASESSISELSTLTVVTERTDPTLTGDTTVHTSVSDSSETTVSPEVSHVTGSGSSVAPWSPGEASVSPAVSGPNATGITQISTDLSTISDSSKPTDSSVTTFTREYGSPEPTSSPSDAFSTSSSFGQTTMFFPVASTVSSTLSDSSNPTFSPDTPHTTDKESPSSSLGPGPSPTSTEVSGQTATPFTKETTAYTHISDLSTTPTSGETSYTQDDEGTTSPSSPGLLSSNPGISGQTNTGLTEGPSVYTDTPNGSKPTSTSDSTVTKEDGSSASTSGPAESFTTSGVDPHTGTTLPPRSPPYTTTSEVSTPAVSTHSSYSTDEESATSQSSSSDLLTTSVLSEQSARTLTEKPTVHTISDSSESTASSYSFRTPGLGSSAAPSSPGEFSSSPVGSRLTASTVTQPPTEHSTVSDSSQPPDSSATTYTKDDESHVSTSGPTESLTTSPGSGPPASPTDMESTFSTSILESSEYTVSSYSTDSSTPSDHEGFPTTSLTTGHSATTFTGLPSVFTTMPDLSKTTISSETFYTSGDGSAVSPSSPAQPSSTLSASAQTTTGLMEGSSMYTGTPHSSKSTVISDSTVSKEDGLSASTSRTAESFTTNADHGQITTSFVMGSAFSTSPSELSRTIVSTHSSYLTDSVIPTDPLTTIFTKDDGSTRSTLSSSESFTSSQSDVQTTESFTMESAVSTTVSNMSYPTVSLSTFLTTGKGSSSSPFGPSVSSTSSQSSGPTATTVSFTEERTLYTNISDMSTSTISSETTSVHDEGSSTSSSSSNILSTTPTVSAETTTGITVKSTLSTGTPNLSKSTDTLATVVTKDNGISFSSLNVIESSTTSGGDAHSSTSFPQGSTFYTITSELPTPLFSTHHSYSTDNASPASPSIPSELSTPTWISEQTTTTLTEEPTIHATISESSESTVSFYSPHPTGTRSSATPWSLGEASTNPAVSGTTASMVPLKSTGHSTIFDFSQPTDSSATTFTKEDRSSMSTSIPGKSFTTSGGDGQTTFPPGSTFYTRTSKVLTPTFSSHSSYSTDKASSASPSSPSDLSNQTVLSEQTTTTLTEESTVYTSASDLSQSTVSSETSFTRFEGSSSSGPGQLSTTSGVSQETSSSLSDGSTVYTDTPDLSKTTVTSDTTLSNENISSAATSNSGETFLTTGGYQETPTSFTMESTVSTILSDLSNPTVPHGTVYTTENASSSSPSGPGELISSTLVSGQTPTSLPEAPTVHTTITDLSYSTGSVVTSSTNVNGSFTSTPSPGELSTTTLVSGQTTTLFTEKPTIYTISDLFSSTVSVDTSSTTPSGGPAPSSGSGLLSSITITTITEESSVFTTTTYSSNTMDSSDAPNTTEDLSALSSSRPIHSFSPPVSGQMPTTLGENFTLFITSSDSAKPMISTSIPSSTDSLSPASPSALTFSSTTRDISRPTATTLRGGSTIFQSSTGSPKTTISSDSSQTTTSHASSLASALPSLSSRPVSDSSSAVTASSGFSPPLSSTSHGSTHAPVLGSSTSSTLHPLFTSTHTTVMTTQSSAMTPSKSFCTSLCEPLLSIFSHQLISFDLVVVLFHPSWAFLLLKHVIHMGGCCLFFFRQCQNGTIWNGKECVCAQGFFGYQCKSLVDSFFLEIPEIINATLGVTVKVTNKNFTKDLNNISSPDYWNFTQLFKSQMDKAYMGKDFPQYRGVIIRRLFNGSVVVEHDVIMEANYTSEFEELFANLSKLIKVKIMNETKRLSGDSEECRASSHLCFSEEATIVSENVMLGFDLKEQCTQKAAKDYAQFYFVDELDGKLACVTKCTSGTKLQLNCNEGECQLQRSGPRCLCPTSDTHWYWGETCALSTSKSLVYGSVGAVGALLVVMVVILTVFLGRSQRKLHR